MSPHVQQEMAMVWSGGGRRYFTRKAAVRGAAKAILRTTLRASGDEISGDAPLYHACVNQLVAKIEAGERPELDWDAAQAKTSGDSETEALGVVVIEPATAFEEVGE